MKTNSDSNSMLRRPAIRVFRSCPANLFLKNDQADAQGDIWPFCTRSSRLGMIGASLLSLCLLAVLCRVAQLQWYPDPKIRELVNTQHTRQRLMARRGSLTDRRGRILAITQTARRLFVDPFLIEDPSTFSERVGYALGYNPAWVEKQIDRRPGSRFVVLDTRLSDKRFRKFKQLKLPGLAVQTHLVRHYPMGSLAGQVIGFVGRDGVGLEGVERIFQNRLASQSGKLDYWRDAHRRPIWVQASQYQPPRDGRDLRLSLDAVIQAIAAEQLAKAVKQFKAQSGQMVVISPRTGEILAMANVPTFDPNQFASTPKDRWRNRCVTDAFEPGSTFKPFIWAAATQAKVMQPGQMVDCSRTGVYRTRFGRRLHDAHAIGLVTWEKVLIKSSNIGMAKAGEKLGISRMYDAVRQFGFGDRPHARLPGEAPGLVQPRAKWTQYTLTSVPMGQEIAVTPLQMARAFCVFANGGWLVQPTIFALDPRRVEDRIQIRQRAISPDVANLTRRILRRVVTEGTGRRANLKSYRLFAKTGTAQMADPVHGGYQPDQYLAAFVCGAPLENPQLVIATFIQKPDKSLGYYGGTVAGPASAKVMEQALAYLGVAPVAPGSPEPILARKTPSHP